MSICGTTETPVLDFWWRLLWVSKLEWATLFELCGGIAKLTHDGAVKMLISQQIINFHSSSFIQYFRISNDH